MSKRIFRRIAAYSLAVIMTLTSVNVILAASLSEDEQTQVINCEDTQLALLEQFLGKTLDPMARMAEAVAFTGGIMGTPSIPFGTPELEDFFLIGVVNEDDMFSESLKDAISQRTGIPRDMILFFYIAPDAFEPIRPPEPRSFSEWLSTDPEMALFFYYHIPREYIFEFYSADEVAAMDAVLAGYGAVSANREEASSRTFNTMFMGDLMATICPAGLMGWSSVGHPTDSSGRRFVTSTHGWGVSGNAFFNGQLIGRIESLIFNSLADVSFVGIDNMSFAISDIIPDTWQRLTQFRAQIPQHGTQVRTFAGMSRRVFHGTTVTYTGNTVIGGWQLRGKLIVNKHGQMLTQGDSGSAAVFQNAALGTLRGRVNISFSGLPAGLYVYTSSMRY